MDDKQFLELMWMLLLIIVNLAGINYRLRHFHNYIKNEKDKKENN